MTFGGEFTRTSPLNAQEWGITIAFGLISFPLSFFSRLLFPVEENPDDFIVNEMPGDDNGKVREFNT